jgi:glycosyltransferase involved in cell wall biosynthesis
MEKRGYFAKQQKSPYKEDIKFIGSVSDEELLQLYNQAELLFYPSYFEGFGLPVVEAMACGLPVVAFEHILYRRTSPRQGPSFWT